MANENETVDDVCLRLTDKWYADHIPAARKREIAAKDAEIESMRRTVKYYEGVVSEKCKENESIRSLNKELCESLREAVIETCHNCTNCNDGECHGFGQDCFVKKWRKVLAKAAGEEDCK